MIWCYTQNGEWISQNGSVQALTRLYLVKSIEASRTLTISDNGLGTVVWSGTLTPLILSPEVSGDRINLFHYSLMNYQGFFYCAEPFRHLLYYSCTPTQPMSGLVLTIGDESFTVNVTNPPASTSDDGWSVQFQSDTRVHTSRLGLRRALVRINTTYTAGGVSVPIPKFAGEVWFMEFLQNDTYRFLYLPVSNRVVIYDRATGQELADGTAVDTTTVCHVEYMVR